ncbi:MAG: F0F1 ATP synthase subunit epsilon [Hyphomicrobiaceae bacterium]
MSGTFKFELVSPERILLSDVAEEAVLPGAEGQFTVLAGHAPVVSTLLPGVIVVKLAVATKGIYIDGGFVEVNPESATVLAEHAFIVDEADQRQLEDALNKAESALAEAKDDDALRHLTCAIDQLRGLQRKKAA